MSKVDLVGASCQLTPKPAAPSARFGANLAKWRKDAGVSTQRAAAEAISKRGRKVSQALIAQYETGRVSDPDPTVLRLMADLYGKDYLGMVIDFVQHKYQPDTESSEIDQQRWSVITQSITYATEVGGVPGLALYQLRAKARLLQNVRILMFDGIMRWEKEFPNLELFWVIVPDFYEDRNRVVKDVVIQNLKRGVKYVYFVQKGEETRGGRFGIFQDSLIRELGPWVAERKLLRAIPIKQDMINLIRGNIIIANPHWHDKAVAFEHIRQGGKLAFSIEMSKFDLAIVSALLRYCHDTCRIDPAEIFSPAMQNPQEKISPGSSPERIN